MPGLDFIKAFSADQPEALGRITTKGIVNMGARDQLFAAFIGALVMLTFQTLFWRGKPVEIVTKTSMAADGTSNTCCEPWRTEQTVDAQVLYQSPFGVVELHRVRSGNQEFVDWLWCDERAHVNILVQRAKDGKFLLFKQKKYGFIGEKLAVVGGFVDDGETPLQAAKRELMEEVGMEAGTWRELGTYRVSVNRGGGYVSMYHAVDAMIGRKLSSDDLEPQQQVWLDRRQLLSALKQEMLGEVKWASTVALALLEG